MISKIELKTMKFYAYHGVAPQETQVGNHFIVDLVITTPFQKAIKSDDLGDTINYADLYGVVCKEMAISSKLLEHVAGRILYSLKQTFPQIEKTEIKIAKLNPPFGGDVYSASVILEESYTK